MGVRLYKEPWLEKPSMLVAWPGIGNVGLIAIDAVRMALQAEELGEIEPWEYFYPKSVIIEKGVLKELEFPANKFYFKRAEGADLLFFIGEEQPAEGRGAYAEGRKAYEIANLVLDVAAKFGCQRIYTSGAAVAPIHHTMKSRVWLAPNSPELRAEASRHENAVLMSNIEGLGGQGSITGLNGLLLGVAKTRGMKGMCIMGEVPMYLQGLSIPYPKASRAVLEVLGRSIGVAIDLSVINGIAERAENAIEELYDRLPAEVRNELDKLKFAYYARTVSESITEEDKKRIMEHIDELFEKGMPNEGKPS